MFHHLVVVCAHAISTLLFTSIQLDTAKVMGPMGSGKSTTISIQLGASYSTDEEGKMCLKNSRNWTPQTSDGWNSKTLQVSTFKDPESGLVYLETWTFNRRYGIGMRPQVSDVVILFWFIFWLLLYSPLSGWSRYLWNHWCAGSVKSWKFHNVTTYPIPSFQDMTRAG